MKGPSAERFCDDVAWSSRAEDYGMESYCIRREDEMGVSRECGVFVERNEELILKRAVGLVRNVVWRLSGRRAGHWKDL